MSHPHPGNAVVAQPELLEQSLEAEISSVTPVEMETSELEKIDVEFSQAQAANPSPRPDSKRPGTRSDSFKYHGRKPQSVRSPPKTPKPFSAVSSRPSSSIPIPLKSQSPGPISKSIKSTRSSSLSIPRQLPVANKHTLEIQFLNKKKRLDQLKKDLIERQKPVLDLYQNLTAIQKRLQEHGKVVQLEEIKFLPLGGESNQRGDGIGEGGETILPAEVLSSMKNSMEEIPKTLMDICKNLLNRRAQIVELLDGVTKSELDLTAVSEKVDFLKSEGTTLEESLDAVITEHEKKIGELVSNWQTLLNDKKSVDTNHKIEELEQKLKDTEKLLIESNHNAIDLQKKLDDKRAGYDKVKEEYGSSTKHFHDEIKRLEQELENERKTTSEMKCRSNSHSQATKSLRNKVSELENEKKSYLEANSELQRKIRMFQDQLKHKEAQWNKEKEDLSKNLKHQENMLQKLTADKHTFETRLDEVEAVKESTRQELEATIENLGQELEATREELEAVEHQRDEAMEKCQEFEEYAKRMGWDFKETMEKMTYSIEWGKATVGSLEMENVQMNAARDVQIRALEDSVAKLQRENAELKECQIMTKEALEPTEVENKLSMQQETLNRYVRLLEESENKLKEKSTEVAKLQSEIRQLKVRQNALEEQNISCPTDDLQKMVEEGRNKLNELMRRSMDNEQKIEHYEQVVERQCKQMNEMENLLRYRDNMNGVLKASRDELLMEKESLTRYSQEMRGVLSEVSKESKMKDRLIKDLQEKIDLREQQISKLEKDVVELEANLAMTNEKRYKLQDTIGAMEKELQSTKAHVNQLADINTRYDGEIYSTSQSQLETINEPFESHFRPVTRANSYSVYGSEYSNQCQPVRESESSQFRHYRQMGDERKRIKVTESHMKVASHHQISSRSLISMSLQKIDYMKTRLNYLTTISSYNSNFDNKPLQSSSTQTLPDKKRSASKFDRILELTAKRCNYLQKQANQSYDDFNRLYQLALVHQRSNNSVIMESPENKN